MGSIPNGNRVWSLAVILLKKVVTFSPMRYPLACLATTLLRTVVSLATGNNWNIRQLEISNAYLNSPLKDEFYYTAIELPVANLVQVRLVKSNANQIPY